MAIYLSTEMATRLYTEEVHIQISIVNQAVHQISPKIQNPFNTSFAILKGSTTSPTLNV